MIFRKFFFSIFICSLSITIYSQTNWVLSNEKDGLKVYYKDGSDSKVKELKFTFTVNSTLSAIVSLLDDVSSYPKWVYKMDESKVLDRISEKEMYYYNVMDFPWPLSDRDMISHTRIYQDKETKIVTSHSLGAPSHITEIEDIVRIKTLEIKYIIKPNFDGTITIDYYLKSDPAGNLPAWLINLALEYGPTETIKSFRNLLKQEPYKSAQLDYILEP